MTEKTIVHLDPQPIWLSFKLKIELSVHPLSSFLFHSLILQIIGF